MLELDESLDRLRDKTQELQKNVDEVLLRAIAEQSDLMEELNRLQLFSGVNPEGQSIKPDYKQITKVIKAAKGQPTDRVILKDTGKLYKSIQYKKGFKEIEASSSVPQDNNLEEKYGVFLGLTEESHNKVLQESIEDIIKFVLLVYNIE